MTARRLEVRTPVYDPTESVFQAHVIAICRTLRLRWYHTHDSRRSPSGFPDLVIVGPGGIIYTELKTRTGRVSKDQRDWIADLRAVGQTVHLWRPADMDDITTELQRLARAA